MKDNELDQLLAEYRNIQPTDLQTAKWKRAVRAELAPKRASLPWMQLAAASVVGFLVGGLVFGLGVKHGEENMRNIASNDETFEFVYVKTD